MSKAIDPKLVFKRIKKLLRNEGYLVGSLTDFNSFIVYEINDSSEVDELVHIVIYSDPETNIYNEEGSPFPSERMIEISQIGFNFKDDIIEYDNINGLEINEQGLIDIDDLIDIIRD